MAMSLILAMQCRATMKYSFVAIFCQTKKCLRGQCSNILSLNELFVPNCMSMQSRANNIKKKGKIFNFIKLFIYFY